MIKLHQNASDMHVYEQVASHVLGIKLMQKGRIEKRFQIPMQKVISNQGSNGVITTKLKDSAPNLI